jgi:hypothetical protein
MLGTVKTSGSYIGAQYIVKVFLCQPFVKEFAKKQAWSPVVTVSCPWLAHFVRSKAQSAKRIAFGE